MVNLRSFYVSCFRLFVKRMEVFLSLLLRFLPFWGMLSWVSREFFLCLPARETESFTDKLRSHLQFDICPPPKNKPPS